MQIKDIRILNMDYIILYSFCNLPFQTFQFVRKYFHILTDFLFRYLGINLSSLDVGMPHHSTDRFYRNSL